MTVTTLTTEFGGRTLTIETGKLARLAGGSVTVQYGDTVLLGTANRADHPAATRTVVEHLIDEYHQGL